MNSRPNTLSHLRDLVRPDFVAVMVSGQWLMTFLAFYIEPEARRNPALSSLGLVAALGLSALVAGGMAVFMLALNDVLDARHDRAFAPTRPIPSGKITQRLALSLAMAGLLAALSASVAFGPVSVEIALVTAGAIVFYNVAGRFVPAVGIVTLGLVLGLMMVIPNPSLAFAWPILLTLTLVVVAASLRYFLAGKRPRLSPINGWGICVGWAFWILVVLALIRVRDGQASRYHLGLIWIGPALAVSGFSLITWLMLGPTSLAAGARRATAARFTKLAAAGLIVFDASWLLSAERWWQAGVVLLLLVLAWVLPPSEPAPPAPS